MMQVRGIRKSFGEGKGRLEVLRGIDFDIEAGESVALVGKSGSGKSTLLSLLAGLESPDSGTISVDGKDLTRLSEKELTVFRSQNIGIVFQQFHLISTLSAYENVLLPMELLKRTDASAEALRLLGAVGLTERREHLPSELSGGESQRVAIARALGPRPKLLFADEPSGNLDEETGEKVMDLLFDLVRETKTTLVLVTHDLDLASRCSRTIHLEHGSLV